MPLLVLAALAGIVGYVGYSEAAKIEKRFRRGPLGIRAWQWGAGGAVVGLVGGFVVPALVVGVLIGYVGYDQAAKYDAPRGDLPFGVPPLGWAVVGFAIATIGAILASAVVVGAIAAFVGCDGAARYERQFGRPLGLRTVRLPAQLWGVPGFVFGVVGALVTSTLTWGIVCAFLALAGALVLLIFERNALVSEKATLVAEKEALIAERSGRRPVGSNGSTPAPPPPAPPAPPAPRPVAAVPNDLLPHRR